MWTWDGHLRGTLHYYCEVVGDIGQMSYNHVKGSPMLYLALNG
jgi:hypothetical protein